MLFALIIIDFIIGYSNDSANIVIISITSKYFAGKHDFKRLVADDISSFYLISVLFSESFLNPTHKLC